MSTKGHMEEIFRKKLYNAEANAPANLFERIVQARSRRKKLLFWRNIAVIIMVAAITSGTFWWSAYRSSLPSSEIEGVSDMHKDQEDDLHKSAPLGKSIIQDQPTRNEFSEGDRSSKSSNPEFLNNKFLELDPLKVSETSADKNWVSEQTEDRIAVQEPNTDPKEEAIPEIENLDRPLEAIESEIETHYVDAASEVDAERDEVDAPLNEDSKNDVAPKPFVAAPWSIALLAGTGGFHPQFVNSEEMRNTVKFSNNRQIQARIQYRLTPAWALETGILWTELNMNMQQVRSHEVQTIKVTEQTVWIYDPISPPVMRTLYDTTFGSRKEEQTLNATYSRQLWSIPLELSRNWYVQKWALGVSIGGQLHLLQKHTGTFIDESSYPVQAQQDIQFSARTSVLTSVRVERKLNDHLSVLIAPSAFADVQSSRWKTDLYRRDAWWNVNAGFRYQF